MGVEIIDTKRYRVLDERVLGSNGTRMVFCQPVESPQDVVCIEARIPIDGITGNPIPAQDEEQLVCDWRTTLENAYGHIQANPSKFYDAVHDHYMKHRRRKNPLSRFSFE